MPFVVAGANFCMIVLPDRCTVADARRAVAAWDAVRRGKKRDD